MKLSDSEKIMVLNVLFSFRLKKLNKMHQRIQKEIEEARRQSEKLRLEAKLAYVSEKRDDAAAMVSLTID